MNNVVLKIKKLNENTNLQLLERELLKNKEIVDVKIYREKFLKIQYKKITIDKIEDLVEKYGYQSLGVDNNWNKKKRSNFILVISWIILLYIICVSNFNILKPNIQVKILLISSSIFMIIGRKEIKNGIMDIIFGKNNINGMITITCISTYLFGIITGFIYLFGNKNYTNYKYLEIMMMILLIQITTSYLSENKEKEIEDEIKQISRTKNRKLKKAINNFSYENTMEIRLEEVKKNDSIVCEKGEKILMDGKVVKGISHIDESLLLGKSKASLKKENDIVVAGSINKEAQIEYKVACEVKESYTSKIKKLICNLQNLDNKKNTIIDKVSYLFLLIVVAAIFLLGISFYIKTKNIYESISVCIKTLLIICPTGYILSEYFPFERIKKNMIKHGYIVKQCSALKELSKVDSVVFDKTGTLTYGYLSITNIFNYSMLNDKELLELVASIEKNSSHILARDIMKFMRNEKIRAKYDLLTEDLDQFAVKARDENNIYYTGGSILLNKLKIDNPYTYDEKKLIYSGCEVLYLIKNKKIIALLGLKDKLRKKSKNTVNYLKLNNIDTYILSGDEEKIVKEIATELGIEKGYFERKPDEKYKIIKELKQKGHKVMMVGDGINDAPAIFGADIGVALKTPIELSSFCADVIIQNGQISRIVDLSITSEIFIKLKKQNRVLSIICSSLILMLFIGFKFSIPNYAIEIAIILNIFVVYMNSKQIKNK